MDCLRSNLEGNWSDLKKSEAREDEEPKTTPVFLAQVDAAGLGFGKKRKVSSDLDMLSSWCQGTVWGWTGWSEGFENYQYHSQ